MVSNYIASAFRNAKRYKLYTFINLIGISIGVSCFLLIMLYIQYEVNFDKQYPQSKNIYRVIEYNSINSSDKRYSSWIMSPLVPFVEDSISQIEWASRVTPAKNAVVQGDSGVSLLKSYYYVDNAFLEIFQTELIRGNKNLCLHYDKQVIISEPIAIQLFGNVENAYGKNITIKGNAGYWICGIMKPFEDKSHLQADALISFTTIAKDSWYINTWGARSCATYVKLRENSNPFIVENEISKKVQLLADSNDASSLKEAIFSLQRLQDIHLNSTYLDSDILNEKKSDNKKVQIFLFIAILIVITACINFINLATSISVYRAKETGIRKTVGGLRKDLIFQYILESLFISLFSILLAVTFMELMLPSFNSILNINLTLNYTTNYLLNIGVVGLWLFVGIFSGSYPAFYLSKFSPIQVFRKQKVKTTLRGKFFRYFLVSSQLIVTFTLIFIAIIIYSQIQYAKKQSIAYKDEQTIIIPTPNRVLKNNIPVFKKLLKENDDIIAVSGAYNPQGVGYATTKIFLDDTSNTNTIVNIGYIDEDFIPLTNMELNEGRNFIDSTDKNTSIIINEAAQTELKLKKPINQKLAPIWFDTLVKNPKIIGVLKNYHFESLHKHKEPAIFIYQPTKFSVVLVKFNKAKSKETMEFIKEQWDKIANGMPFDYKETKDLFENVYVVEISTLKLILFFAIISIIIAYLGLFGLAAFSVQQRTKEIGIRKVFGGSSINITIELIKGFVLLITMSCILAIPVSSWFAKQWLQNFAYYIEIDWFYFLYTYFLIMLITMITIVFYTYKYSNTNPVETLRYE